MLDQVFTNAASSITFGIVWVVRADVSPAAMAALTASGVAIAVGIAAFLMLRILRGLRGKGSSPVRRCSRWPGRSGSRTWRS